MKTFNEYLTEFSLSRAWSYFNDPAITAGIISASRQERTAQENASATRALASQVRAAGYGYVFVDGQWNEVSPTGTSVPVKETSLIIRGEETNRLRKYLRDWMQQYDQEGVIYKPKGATYVIVMAANGTETRIGAFHPDKAADLMTKLRGRGERSFVFESAWVPMNWIQRVLHNAQR